MPAPPSDSIWNTIVRVSIVVALLGGSVALVFPPVADYAGDLLNGNIWSGTKSLDKSAPSSAEKAANAESKPRTKPAPSFRPEWDNPTEAPKLAPTFAAHRPPAAETDAAAMFDSSVMPASASQDIADEQAVLQSHQSELKRLGATYMVVERVKGSELFECRCLANLNSKYSKAFSAEASSPNEAASQVVEQLKQWKRSKSRVASSQSNVSQGNSSQGKPKSANPQAMGSPTAGSPTNVSTKSKERRSPKKVER